MNNAKLLSPYKERSQGAILLSGGYTLERAESELEGGLAALIALGGSSICNPDLVERFVNGWPLSKDLDAASFYSPGKEGCTDYPVSDCLPERTSANSLRKSVE